MRGKLSFVVAILVVSSAFLNVSVAEEEPGGPPEGSPYIKHWTVNPPWSYKDSIIYFWAIYFDSENRSIDSANIFIDNISYDLWENTTNSTLENPKIGKNFLYQAEQPWERKTYEFYFSIRTGLIYANTSIGTFDIVNREPYLLETPPTKLDVAEEFEWKARAFDPDLDYISWSHSSNLTGSGEWEWESNNTSAKLKIKCAVVEKGYVNVTIWDNYTGIDFWNWSLTCYPANSGKHEPVPPRGFDEPTLRIEKPLFRLGEPSPFKEDPPNTSEPEPKPKGFLSVKTWAGSGGKKWGTAANWNPSGVPVDGDDVVFNSDDVDDCKLDEDTANLNSITMDTGYTGVFDMFGGFNLRIEYASDSYFLGVQGELKMAAGIMRVAGDFDTSSASFTITPETGTVMFTGDGTVTTRDHVDYGLNNVDVAAGTTRTAVSRVFVRGLLNVDGAIAGSYWRLTGNPPIAFGGSGTAATARVEFGTQANHNIPAGTYEGFSLHMGFGYKATLTGAVSTNYFSVYRSGYYSASGSTELDLAGYSFTVSGTIVASAVGYSGGSRPGILTCGASTVDINGLGLNVFVDSYIVFGNSVWTVTGDWAVTSTDVGWDEGGALVTFDEAGDQNIDNNGLDFHHVVIAGSGTKYFTDDVDIDRMWISSTLTQNAATVLTVTDKGNITVNGTFNINGGITRSSADWWHFFSTGTINTLNSACILYVEIGRPLTYTIASSTNTTIENVSVVSPASQTTNQISWYDWADIDTSGDRFLIMNTTQTTGAVEYTLSNLTTSNEYNVWVGGVLDDTLTADASGQIYWTYNSWSTKEIQFGRKPANDPPVILDKIVEEYWTFNISMAHQWNSSDSDLEANTWSLGGNPGYLVLDQGYRTAFLNGTCPASDVGKSHPIYLNVTDGTDSDQEIFTLYCVNVAPTIDDPIVEEYWTTGVAMAHQWNSTDPDLHSNTWTMAGNPGYLSYENGYRTTWINGTCNDPGKSHPIYLNVTDGAGSDQEIFTLFCQAVPPATEFYFFGHVDAAWDNAANWEPTSASDFPQDADDSAYIVSGDVTIEEGASVLLTIGYFQINSTYTDTVTSALDLTVDSSGAKNGSVVADGSNTWNMASYDVNLDGDFYIGDTTISNPARITFQGATTQNLQSGGETLYQITVDTSGTILYLTDDAIFFDITIGTGTTFEIDAISEGVALTLQFSDLANAGFVSTSAGQNTFQGDGTYGVTIESTAAPPTNRWSNSGYNIQTDATYTTFSYFSIYRISDYGDTITDSLFEQYNDEVEITQNPILTDVTFDNGFDNAVFETDCNRLTNIVITNTGRNDIVVTTNTEVEMVDSNFDDSNVDTTGTGQRGVISETHNDTANRWVIVPAGDWLLSSVINKPGTGDSIEIMRPNTLSADHDFILDGNIQLDEVLIRGSTTFQIGQDTPTASRTLTFDDVASAGFHKDSAGTLRGSGTSGNHQNIVSAASPPTNYWLAGMHDGRGHFDLDWTDMTHMGRIRATGDIDIENCTITDSTNGVQINAGSTITNFNNITIDADGGAGINALESVIAHDSFYNVVITGTHDHNIGGMSGAKLEFLYSNFDPSTIDPGVAGEIISAFHNDSATHFLIMGETDGGTTDLSSLTLQPTGASDVEFYEGDAWYIRTFVIDQHLDTNNVHINWRTHVTLNTYNWNITGNANLTVNGTLASTGFIDYTGAQWYVGYVGYDGKFEGWIWLNDSYMDHNDMVISFPYNIGASNWGRVNELNISQPAGADNSVNITQRDFSVKGSGTVITFMNNNSASVNVGYTVTNLTTGLDYSITLNGTEIYSITAASSQVSWSHATEGIQEFAVTFTTNITGPPPRPPGGGGPYPVTFAGFTTKIFGDRTVCYDASASHSDFNILAYYWEFGDGMRGRGEKVCHLYDFSQPEFKYVVNLTVIDSDYQERYFSQNVKASNWNFYIGMALIFSLMITLVTKATIMKRVDKWITRSRQYFQ